MNSTPNKFTRFLKNNAALLLIIFCVLAIAAVVLAVTLTDGGNNVLPDDDVVINPNPDEPDEEKPTVTKVYFASPVDYTVVTMDYTDGEDVLFVFNPILRWILPLRRAPTCFPCMTAPWWRFPKATAWATP